MHLAIVASALAFEAQVEELPSGDTLIVVEDDRADLVKMVVRFPVGDFSPYWQDEHIRDAWGYQYYDSEGVFRQRAEDLVADIDLYSSSRTATISALCLREDMAACAQLLSDILLSTDIDVDELKRSKKGQKAGWKARLSDPEFVRRQAAERAMYVEEDPRRRDVEKPAKVSTKAQDNAEAKMAIVTVPDRVVAYSGNISLEEARALTEGLLPESTSRLPEMEITLPDLAERDVGDVVVELPELTQVYFSLYRPGLVHGDPHTSHQSVAHHVLVGHFYSRMSRALRHDSGLTYGVSGSDWLGNSETCYRLSSYSKVETGEEAIDVMRDTLATFHVDGITETEREQAISYLLGEMARSNQAPWNLRWDRVSEITQEWPEYYYRDLMLATQELSVEDINGWISDFYDPANFRLVKVVPEQ